MHAISLFCRIGLQIKKLHSVQVHLLMTQGSQKCLLLFLMPVSMQSKLWPVRAQLGWKLEGCMISKSTLYTIRLLSINPDPIGYPFLNRSPTLTTWVLQTRFGQGAGKHRKDEPSFRRWHNFLQETSGNNPKCEM